MPQGPYYRKYGVEATFNFVLMDTDGVDYKTDAVHASGDTKIMKDEGAEANTSNGFVDEGQAYSITLTAAEMEAARIMVHVVDQSTKAWLDTSLIIETYGHASAQHAFDLDSATVTLADGGITAAKLGSACITAAKLDTGCITVDELAATALTAIADAVISRGVANVESSADVDSLAALILSWLHVAVGDTTMIIYKTDDSTIFDTKAVTKSGTADPITSVADP